MKCGRYYNRVLKQTPPVAQNFLAYCRQARLNIKSFFDRVTQSASPEYILRISRGANGANGANGFQSGAEYSKSLPLLVRKGNEHANHRYLVVV